MRPVRWVHLASPTACPTEPNARRGARVRRKRPPQIRNIRMNQHLEGPMKRNRKSQDIWWLCIYIFSANGL
jgi:hypothetical protein